MSRLPAEKTCVTMQEQSTNRPEPIDVLWVGDPAGAQQALARRAPHITITARDAKQALEGLRAGSLRADLLVIDATFDDFEVAFVGQLQSSKVDLPTILLTRPGSDDLAQRAGQLATCDSVVKTPDFVLQLLPAFNQVRARHDLQALFRASRQSQDRLRTIVEFQPSVTCVIGTDGVLTAMNQAGLALLGTGRENVVGRPITDFLPADERAAAIDLVRTVCGGEAGELEHTLVRPDGRSLKARLRAVPFRSGDTMVALATIQERAGAAADQSADLDRLTTALEETQSERARLAAERDKLLEERAELDALRHERAGWTAARAQLEAQRADLESKIGQASPDSDEALQQALAEVESLRAERTGWTAARAELESQVRDAAGHQAAALQKALADVEALHAERNEWAAARQVLEDRLLAVSEGSSDSLRQAVEEAAALRRERDAWADQRTQLEATLHQTATSSAQALRQAQTDLAGLRDEQERAVRERQQLEGRLIETAQSFALALRQAQTDLELLRAERAAWAEERAHLETRLRESSQDSDFLQVHSAEVETLRHELAKAAAERAALEKTVHEHSSASTHALRQAKSELEALRREQENLIEARTRLERALQDLSNTSGAALTQVQAEAAALRTERDRLAADRAALEARLRTASETSTAAIRHVRAEVDALTERGLKLASERLGLENALKDTNARAESDRLQAHQELEGLRRSQAANTEVRAKLEAQWNERIEQAETALRDLVEEREQLTRVIHTVTGRCDKAEAEKRRADAAWREAEARAEREAGVAAELSIERDDLTRSLEAARADLESIQSRFSSLETTYGEERNVWAGEAETARRTQRQLTTALESERSRAASLESSLASARSLIDEWSELQHSLAADRHAVLQLREDLLRFVADADGRCRALVEHQDAALARCDEIHARSTV
jgi:PAS domain S-box-containing protein